MILLLMLMVFTGCNKMEFNPYTTIIKEIVKHDIKTNRMVESSEFDIYVTLLMPSIQNVKLAQVDIKNKQLIIKGLVRDVSREQETIEQLTSLFAGDLIIVNQLELVVKHESVIEKFEFELTPLPEIEQQ